MDVDAFWQLIADSLEHAPGRPGALPWGLAGRARAGRHRGFPGLPRPSLRPGLHLGIAGRCDADLRRLVLRRQLRVLQALADRPRPHDLRARHHHARLTRRHGLETHCGGDVTMGSDPTPFALTSEDLFDLGLCSGTPRVSSPIAGFPADPGQAASQPRKHRR